MSDNTHMNAELAKTIDKVRKLLALSKNNTNENEVKAATSAADRLMQEHRISQAMLEAQDSSQSEPMVRKVVSEGGRRTAWREYLLAALTLHYGCAWYLSSYRYGGSGGRGGGKGAKGVQSYTVVGRESDVAIVEYMYVHLQNEVERLCRWHAGGRGVKYALAWMVGCAGGIAKQFDDMRAAARAQVSVVAHESTSSALAILDKRGTEAKTYMSSLVGTKLASSVHGAQDYEARAHGYSEGKKVQIRQGLAEGATATPKLA